MLKINSFIISKIDCKVIQKKQFFQKSTAKA
jgi:hypothetical protein